MIACPFLIFSQDKTIDSLQGLLQNAQHDTTKISLNYQLSEQLAGYDLARADQYLEAGYKLAKSTNNTYYIAQYFLNKGKLLFDKAMYRECGPLFDSAFALFNGLLGSVRPDDPQVG